MINLHTFLKLLSLAATWTFTFFREKLVLLKIKKLDKIWTCLDMENFFSFFFLAKKHFQNIVWLYCNDFLVSFWKWVFQVWWSRPALFPLKRLRPFSNPNTIPNLQIPFYKLQLQNLFFQISTKSIAKHLLRELTRNEEFQLNTKPKFLRLDSVQYLLVVLSYVRFTQTLLS